MSIKFVCGCGKRLRADESMASCRVLCPGCRTLVGVPSLDRHHDGALAPLTPAERIALARKRGASPLPSDGYALHPDNALLTAALDPSTPPPSPRKRKRLRRAAAPLEKSWQECLLYPVQNFRWCVLMALMLTVLGVAVSIYLRRLGTVDPVREAGLYWSLHTMLGGFVVMLVGLPCSFLNHVLASAAGDASDDPSCTRSLPAMALRGVLRWLLCLLAGPILLAGLGWYYWLSSEGNLIDSFILLQLGVVAVAYQLLALLAISERGFIIDLEPGNLADIAYRMGAPGHAVLLGASVVLLLHCWWVFSAFALMQQSGIEGFLKLLAGWVSLLFLGTFFCRWLGMLCFRSRLSHQASQPTS